MNLYGSILCLALPLSNFRWFSREELEIFDILKLSADSETGYILEIDLECPKDRMDYLDELSLAEEHLTLTYEHLSPYAKKLCDRLQFRGTYPCRKLIPNFFAKNNYITHYLNLKFYLE